MYLDQYNVWNAPTMSFIASSQKIYYFDGTGNVLQEQDEIYNTGTSSFEFTAQILYTYSLLTNTTTYSTWNGSSFVNNYMYTDTYDSTGDLLTDLYQTFNGSAWVNQILKVYSGFTGHLPSTEVDQTWDTTGTGTWDNNKMYMYTYNSFGQMTSSIGESYTVGTGWEFAAGDPASFYYYQSYTPTVTSVKTVVNNGGDANLYPVPAQGTLHVAVNWNEAQSGTVALFDMNGREVSTLDIPFGTQFNGTISVSNLADGMYIIRINGTQSQIVKQIVVAH